MKAVVKRSLKLPSVYAFALSPQGDRLAAIGRGVVMANTVSMERLYACRPLPHPSHAAFSPDGLTLAVKSTSGRIVLLAAGSGEIVSDLTNEADGEGAPVGFSACGRYLVDATWNGDIVVRDTLRQVPDLRDTFGGDMVQAVLPSADRATWAFVHQPIATSVTDVLQAAYVTIWQWPLTGYRKIALAGQIGAAALSPDGAVLAVASASHVHFILVEDDAVLHAAPVERCRRIRWSPDGTRVALVLPSRIAVHAYPGHALVEDIAQEFASDICFSPDNSFVAIGGWGAGVLRRFGG